MTLNTWYRELIQDAEDFQTWWVTQGFDNNILDAGDWDEQFHLWKDNYKEVD